MLILNLNRLKEKKIECKMYYIEKNVSCYTVFKNKV